MNLSEALAFVCGEHFLQINPLFSQVFQKIDIQKSNCCDDLACASWLAKDSHWFTIMKWNDNTLVYCHCNQMAYYASPNIQLPSNFPDNHAFLAQTTLDNGQFPRLLIFDLVLPVFPDPMQRGSILRTLSPLFPATCHVQWSGHLEALKKFVNGGNLPHLVDGLVGYTNNPLEIKRLC